ncbi:OmpA family protein [Rhodobacteraceae bacterium NNCM2]|nr:OmpA family protein [Coraliihabitans acroporae]
MTVARVAGAGGRLLVLLALAGCADDPGGYLSGERWDVDAAAALPVPDDPMLQSMRERYLAHAQHEAGEPDWNGVADYVSRLRQISTGTIPQIRDVEELDIEELDLIEIVPVRNEILALEATPGAVLRAGPEIGRAQGDFDCWAEQLDEGHQTDDIARCRTATLEALAAAKKAAQLPENWVVVLPEEGETGGVSLSDGASEVLLDQANAAASADGAPEPLPVTQSEVSEVFGAAQAAAPMPPMMFELTFESGRTVIDTEGFEAILAASNDVRRRNEAGAAAEILITGHADAVGETAENLALSRSRAQRVATAINYELRPDEGGRFTVNAKGERDLAIPTPASEERNRRVTILVR